MKKHLRSKSRRRSLYLENLETRAMLAGNVTATVSGSTLFVTGDPADNQVIIQQTGTDRFTVVGATGSGTTVNGQPEGVVFTGAGVRNFEIDLKAGNDSLGNSNDLTYLDDLSLELAAGPGGPLTPAGTTATALTLRGFANIRGGSGDDAIAVQLRATGGIFIDANTGADAVVVEGSTAASLVILGDTGSLSTGASDYVRIRNVAAQGSIVVNTFSGDDTVLLTDDTAAVMVLDAGLGATSSTSTDIDSLSAARLVASGSILTYAGAGDDTITVTDVDASFFLSVGGIGDDSMGFAYLDVNNATLLGYLGDDSISVDDTINAEDPATPIVVDDTNNTEVNGQLLVDSGDGNDTVTVFGEAAFNILVRVLTVNTFGGDDFVTAANVSADGNALIDVGTGDDDLAVSSLTSGASALLFAGPGNDFVAVTGAVAPFFLTVGGLGDDGLSFAGLDARNASLIGNEGMDNITVDDTVNALDPATPIVVDGTNTTQVADLLHIDTGADDDTVNINGDAAFNVLVGRLDVWTWSGIDTVSVANVSATGLINVDLTDGDDILTLDTVSTDGGLNVFMGSGDDDVTATNVRADGGARARFFGALGDDTFTDGGGNGVKGTDYFLFSVENEL